MAKKKSKVASNRGYATTSAPSKKIEPTPKIDEKLVKEEPVTVAEVTTEQENPFGDILTSTTETTTTTSVSKTTVAEADAVEDPVLKLIKKFGSLNEHKAQIALERLLKEDTQLQQLPEDRLKKFRLTAELEKELLQVIKHKHGDIFGKKKDKQSIQYI